MQIRYHQLIGKEVVTADGERVGRVADLVAEGRAGALCVTALLVGPGALLRRIAFKRLRILKAAPPTRVSWEMVARVADAVYLRVKQSELRLEDVPEEETPLQEARSEPPERGDA